MNDAQLTEWFKRWRKPIIQYLSRRPISRDDLDDIAQETFERIIRYRDDEIIRYPQTYIFRIAINIANERTELKKNRTPHSAKWLEDIFDSFDIEDSFDREIENQKIVNAIATLPERQAAALKMHIFDGMPYKAIAKEMHVTPRIVMRDLSSAYAEIRRALPDLCRQKIHFNIPAPDRDVLLRAIKTRSIPRAARHFGVDPTVLKRWLRELGIDWVSKAFGSEFDKNRKAAGTCSKAS